MSLNDAALSAAGKIVKQAQGLKDISEAVCGLETGSSGKPNWKTVCQAAKELDRDGGLRGQTEAESAADAAELALTDDVATFKGELDAVADPTSAGTIALLAQYCDDPSRRGLRGASVTIVAVSVSVSFSPAHCRSGETRSRPHASSQPPMNPGERP
ncbi:hypothetical protein AB0G87_38875 [Streptomyces asoensis]|uniref:hypothetical protein n=1 Tax=Streptomyces asoensis TaxID=249586 RepID=UPI0033CB0F0D